VRFRGPRKQRLAGPWHRPSGPCHPALAPVTHLYSRPTRKRLHQEPPASPAPPPLPAGEEGGAGAAEGNGAGGLEEETHTQIPSMNLVARQPVHVTTSMNLEVRRLHLTTHDSTAE